MIPFSGQKEFIDLDLYGKIKTTQYLENTTEIFIAQSQNNVFKIFFNANHQKQPYRGDLQSSYSSFMVQKLKKYLRKSSIFVKLQAYSRSGEQLQGRTAFCRTPIFAEHLLVGPSESWGGRFFMKINT